MKSDLKQLGKETAIYGISTILSRFLNFLLVPFYTNIFAQAEYGIVTNVYAYIALLNIIYLYGMESAYLKYASTEELGDERETFSTAFNSVFLTSIIFSLLILLFQNLVGRTFGLERQNQPIVPFVAGILFFDALSTIVFARLRFHNRALRFASIKTINIVVNVILNIILIYRLKLRIEGVFIAALASSILTFILLLPELIKSYKLKINKVLLNGLLRFGLPFVPAGFASIVTHVIDRPILLALTDASTVGVYQANYKLGIFMMLYVSMFQYAWQPFYLKKASQEDAKEIFAKVFTYFTLIGSFIFLVLSVFIEDIVRIKIFGFYLIGKDFWGGLHIVPIILLGYLFNGFYFNFLAGLQIEKKTQYMPLVTGLGALVNVSSNFMLIPIMGITGAAAATFFAYLTMSLYQYYLSQKFYPIKYEWNKVFKSGLILIFVFAGFLILRNYVYENEMFIKFLVVITYIALLKIFKLIDLKVFKFIRT